MLDTGVFLLPVFIRLGHELSGSFEFVRRNACVHRLDLCLNSHPKEFEGGGGGGGDWSQNHVNSKVRIPSTGKKISSEEDRTHGAASRRTASPTHYQRAVPARNGGMIAQRNKNRQRILNRNKQIANVMHCRIATKNETTLKKSTFFL